MVLRHILRYSLAALLLCLPLLASCGGQAPSPPPDNAPAAAGNGPGKPAFTLGAGDTVTVAVWKFDDLKRTALIDPAGNLILPLAGQVHAAGLTPDELRAELEKRYATQLVNPVVDVSVATLHSASVHVLGEVKNPGSFTLDKKILAQEAIARAGGFTTDGDQDRVLLIRSEQAGARVYVLSLTMRYLEAGASDYRLVQLANDDILYVPPYQITDVARFLARLESVLEPFISAGRGVIIGDQVYQIYRGKGQAGTVIAP